LIDGAQSNYMLTAEEKLFSFPLDAQTYQYLGSTCAI